MWFFYTKKNQQDISVSKSSLFTREALFPLLSGFKKKAIFSIFVGCFIVSFLFLLLDSKLHEDRIKIFVLFVIVSQKRK